MDLTYKSQRAKLPPELYFLAGPNVEELQNTAEKLHTVAGNI